jgi:choline dehydrogenase
VFRIDGDRVVLAGGATATPGILLRSGVGPRDELARLGVELVAHVPGVGVRLLDHPGVAIFFWPHDKGFASVDDPLIQTVHRYTAEGSECPNDMQVQPGSFIPLPGHALPATVISACLGKVRGTGTFRLRSARATDAPILETNFLSDPEDEKRLHDALRIIARLADTKAIKKVARAVYPHRPFASGGLRGALAQITGSGYHPCGTVPMGADDDELAATDGRGRVRGVEGLYVVDASLMPTIPSSNTNLPTLMMGERFGAWLKET